jgi:PhzF family phenazine biosynthesis protein
MATERLFQQVDVFGSQPYLGNPLAVVLEGEGLDDATMQRFASWTNLSETTFLLPPTVPEADYRVRIFTPARELPFAGHPTLGSCHAWLKAGGQPRNTGHVMQECGVGLVRIKRGDSRLAFAAPKLLRSGPVEPELLDQIARGLGVKVGDLLHHQWADNGPGWVAVMLRSAEQVLSIEPDYAILNGLELGLVGAYPGGSECQFEVRALVTKAVGRPYEDPVTGSLNASVAQWLMGAGLAPERYTASQGAKLGRAGRIFLERDAQAQVWVGGESVTGVEGKVWL